MRWSGGFTSASFLHVCLFPKASRAGSHRVGGSCGPSLTIATLPLGSESAATDCFVRAVVVRSSEPDVRRQQRNPSAEHRHRGGLRAGPTNWLSGYCISFYMLMIAPSRAVECRCLPVPAQPGALVSDASSRAARPWSMDLGAEREGARGGKEGGNNNPLQDARTAKKGVF